MERLRETKISHWVDKLAVEHEPGLTTAEVMLTNEDLKPVEPAKRQWGPWNYVGFWVADAFNINTWMISSTMVINGLSWWQSWLCVWTGYFIASCFVAASARPGAVYHVSFPVVVRASWGVWGGLWPVLNRVVMAVVWYGVQGYLGGECVYIMIAAIWPSWRTVPNGIPHSSGVTTAYFASFFIFWLLSLPAIWFPVHKIRHLFTVKAYVVPTSGMLFLIWTLIKAHGAGSVLHQGSKIHGSTLGWQVVKGIMSCIANFATLICNAPDFARVARKPKDALYSQIFAIPLSFGVTSLVGIIVSSSSSAIYGQPIWNPLDLLTRFLDDASSAARVGVFFIAFAFALAQLGTNIAANSISAGTDMTALLPKWLTIRRGGYICAAIGLTFEPWRLVASGTSFGTYLSAYSVFLSSITGVTLCDYYLVRKGYFQVRDLYSAQQTGTYTYWHGINWRAYASYIGGLALNMPGFVGACGATVPKGAQYVFNLNYFGGFLVSAILYYTLCHFFPAPGMMNDHWMEVGDEFTDASVAYDTGDNGVYDVERGTGQDTKGAEIYESGIRDRKGGHEM